MLKYMREQMGKTFLFIIVAAIALVFVLWGVFPDSGGMGGGAGGRDVARVAGERISIQELQNAVNRDIENYRALGMDLPPAMVEQIKVGTLDNLVRNKLMLVEARRLGVLASDKEVSEEIQNMPYFLNKDTKKFDVELYRKILADNNLTPGEFEEDVRESLTNQRMMKFLESRIRVTPVEVEREFEITNETRNLEFVRFSREDAFDKMKVTEKDIDAFLADKDAEGKIQNFYATNNTRYNKPEQICARHILIRGEPGEDASAATPPKSVTSLKPNPQNFAELARKHSADPGSKDKGGDLECFPRGVMDKAFESVAFSTPMGKVSDPVKSQFGWHYILPYKKEEAVNQPIAKVKREIAEELIKRDRVAQVRELNMAAAQQAVKNWPPKRTETTGHFNSLEGMIPKIGRAEEIMKAAFDPKAKIQSAPQVFEAQGGVIVARVKDRKSADMSKLKQDEEKHARTLRERKMRAFLPAWLEDVKSRTKVSYNNSVINQM